MPIENYVVRLPEERTEQRKFNDGFTMNDLFEKDRVSDHERIIEPWRAFDEAIKPKRFAGRAWPIFSSYRLPEEEREPTSVRVLKRGMKISTNEANALVDQLYNEIDQIAREKDAEPFSREEKEQLVLAITKTAGNLIKDIFKKK